MTWCCNSNSCACYWMFKHSFENNNRKRHHRRLLYCVIGLLTHKVSDHRQIFNIAAKQKYFGHVNDMTQSFHIWVNVVSLSTGTLCWAEMFAFLGQVKIRRKLKSTDKDNSPTSPTIPSITYDSVFDSGRELSSDVYSTVGTGNKEGTNSAICLSLMH